MKNEIQLSNFYNIKTINVHSNKINSLILLNDNRIASCSSDKTIRIFNPSNNYHCDETITERIYSFDLIYQLEDGTLVSCTSEPSIHIGNFTIEKPHTITISKVISLPNNRMASSSYDKTIKIWKSAPPYSDTPIKVFKDHSTIVISLLYIKERDIMISGSPKEIILRNMSTYQVITVMKGVSACMNNAIFQIDKDRIIVGGIEEIQIVNIEKGIIEKEIKNLLFRYVCCYLKLRDNKTILIGCTQASLCLYNIETNKYIFTTDMHEEAITGLIRINDDTIVSSSRDKTIKVWKY